MSPSEVAATGCGTCGGWGCYRCERAADVRRKLDVALAELKAERQSTSDLKDVLTKLSSEAQQWRRKYEALICASRGIGYE